MREALLFSAVLKLPQSMSLSEKQDRAMSVAELLNLTRSLDNVVGSSLIKGISGEGGGGSSLIKGIGGEGKRGGQLTQGHQR